MVLWMAGKSKTFDSKHKFRVVEVLDTLFSIVQSSLNSLFSIALVL